MTDDEIAATVFTIPETCTLDVAGQGGVTLEKAGKLLNASRSMASELIPRVFSKLRPRNLPGLRDHLT